LIYECLEGISMLQDMNARPWMLMKHARSFADLHIKVNQQSIPELPSYKDRLNYDIRTTAHLSEDLRSKALAILKGLPAGKDLCQGDYHPGNVLITGSGSVIIVWVTASDGSPWTDVARTSLILSIGAKRPARRCARSFDWSSGSIT
jgi:thiamine kinase-like enzyme